MSTSETRRTVEMHILLSALLFAISISASGLNAQETWIVGQPSLDETSIIHDRDSSTARAFLSLNEAIAALKETSLSGDITIRLSPGTYRLDAPLILDSGQKGKGTSAVAILGTAAKDVVISGGRLLGDPAPVTDPDVLGLLPNQSKKHVVQFDLGELGLSEFGPLIRRGFGQTVKPGSLELYFHGSPMPRARWPNREYATIEKVLHEGDRTSFFIGKGASGKLAREKNLLASGYWGNDWAYETIPVMITNPQTGLTTLEPPGSKYPIKTGQRAFFENALSELDSPGEWYLDREVGVLYFWPPSVLRSGDVEISWLDSLLIINNVDDLLVSDITFELSRGDGLVINGGSGVHIKDVTIRKTSGRAITASGIDHKVLSADIYDAGEGGIVLSGGDRQTLTPGRLSVENSRIFRFSRLSRTYRPAIQLIGVGNRAIGNYIFDGNHSAIIFSGNDHLIAFNDISLVAKDSGDVGAIYTGRDWTARGTVIRDNYFHDIHGTQRSGSRGVYLDDQASGIEVIRNLFVKVDSPVFIGGGRDNVVENNIMIHSSPAIHVDARGLTWQRKMTNDLKDVLRRRLSMVPYNQKPYRDRYAHLASILSDELGAPKYNSIRDNIVIAGQPLRVLPAALPWANANGTRSDESLMLEDLVKKQLGSNASGLDSSDVSAALDIDQELFPIAIMKCVSSRWKDVDLGNSPRKCPVH